MRYEIGYQPSYSLAIINLDPGEEIRCESGAMVSMSNDLKLEVKMNAGKESSGLFGAALGAIKKSVLGGESFFITTIKAQNKGGEVTLAPATPGDITALDMAGKSLLLQGGAFLASTSGVEVDTKVNLKGMIGGEGLFFLKVTGRGTLMMTSFGAIHKKDLVAGEKYVVDSGHIVAYEEHIPMHSRMAADQDGGGWFNVKKMATSAASGEGLVMEFTGPGTIWMQTRNPDAFSSWLYKLLPKPSQSQGALSGLVGGGSD